MIFSASQRRTMRAVRCAADIALHGLQYKCIAWIRLIYSLRVLVLNTFKKKFKSTRTKYFFEYLVATLFAWLGILKPSRVVLSECARAFVGAASTPRCLTLRVRGLKTHTPARGGLYTCNDLTLLYSWALFTCGSLRHRTWIVENKNSAMDSARK